MEKGRKRKEGRKKTKLNEPTHVNGTKMACTILLQRCLFIFQTRDSFVHFCVCLVHPFAPCDSTSIFFFRMFESIPLTCITYKPYRSGTRSGLAVELCFHSHGTAGLGKARAVTQCYRCVHVRLRCNVLYCTAWLRLCDRNIAR